MPPHCAEAPDFARSRLPHQLAWRPVSLALNHEPALRPERPPERVPARALWPLLPLPQRGPAAQASAAQALAAAPGQAAVSVAAPQRKTANSASLEDRVGKPKVQPHPPAFPPPLSLISATLGIVGARPTLALRDRRQTLRSNRLEGCTCGQGPCRDGRALLPRPKSIPPEPRRSPPWDHEPLGGARVVPLPASGRDEPPRDLPRGSSDDVCVVAIFCHSGRHRSVALALLVAHVARMEGWQCGEPDHVTLEP